MMFTQQLRTVYRKLETDLQTNKKRHTGLVEQCEALKKGREESVSNQVLDGPVGNLEIIPY